jgi:Protein of unknown function (DUF3126)
VKHPFPWQSGAARANPARYWLNGVKAMDKVIIQKLETYLRRQFSNAAIRVVPRAKKKDSAEVYMGDEFIGVLTEDKEDGDTSYFFEMAILDVDLED